MDPLCVCVCTHVPVHAHMEKGNDRHINLGGYLLM